LPTPIAKIPIIGKQVDVKVAEMLTNESCTTYCSANVSFKMLTDFSKNCLSLPESSLHGNSYIMQMRLYQ